MAAEFECVVVNWRASPGAILGRLEPMDVVLITDDTWQPIGVLHSTQIEQFIADAVESFEEIRFDEVTRTVARQAGGPDIERYEVGPLVVRKQETSFTVSQKRDVAMDYELPGKIVTKPMFYPCQKFGHPNWIAFYSPDLPCDVKPPDHTIG